MNKVAVISDIHGNLPALEAVLEDIKSREIEQIYCLGDLVGYYCFFNEVVEKIKDLNIPTVLGNHDYALINNDGVISRSKTCTRVLKWQLEVAKPDTLLFLKSLPSSIEESIFNSRFKFVHAGLKDNIDEYLFDVGDDYFDVNEFKQDVLVSGHTHLCSYKSFYSGRRWFNPGSVGQPRDWNNKASYLILDEQLNPEFVRISYDYDLVIKTMKEFGFDDYIANGLTNGRKIG